MDPWRFAFICGVTVANAHFHIVAHRGASFDAPENTLAAERLAWAQGADAVETDVHLSRDGHLVACHDENTKRTTGRDLAIARHTLAELRGVEAGRWKAAEFAGEKLPTLDEQLALVPAGKRLVVEVKGGPEVVDALAACLARTPGAEAGVSIISFHLDTLREVRRMWPKLPIHYLASYHPRLHPSRHVDALIGEVKAAALTGLDLESTWPLTPADAERIRAAGLELHVWTIDDPAIARRWINLGAASITTNRPGWLRQQLSA